MCVCVWICSELKRSCTFVGRLLLLQPIVRFLFMLLLFFRLLFYYLFFFFNFFRFCNCSCCACRVNNVTPKIVREWVRVKVCVRVCVLTVKIISCLCETFVIRIRCVCQFCLLPATTTCVCACCFYFYCVFLRHLQFHFGFCFVCDVNVGFSNYSARTRCQQRTYACTTLSILTNRNTIITKKN